MSSQIGPYKYPATDYLDNLYEKEDIAYDLYKQFYPDADHVSFYTWKFRMNKFKFDYSGLQNLFISNPTIDYLTGETKVNKDI